LGYPERDSSLATQGCIHPCECPVQKDNTDIIRNTFGTLLKTKLKQIRKWGVVSIVDGEVEWGGGGGDTAR
jgi:hypothetical protein